MKPPNVIETKDPREAISFGISIAIEQGMLPKNFKMSEIAWTALTHYLHTKWDDHDHKELAVMIENFVCGYAIGSDQFMFDLSRRDRN